ncbi:hypothetical protein KEJ34_00095 [Candidatus Bathyarchaeota archaeon]|nr:hypothetical protein [Candidatus Bathyarchaeota archaeon]
MPISTPKNILIKYAFSYQWNWTVPDCDATNDGEASIILPAYVYLDTDGDGVEETKKQVSYYMVYLVGLGKPKDDSLIIIYPQAAYNESWTVFQLNEENWRFRENGKDNRNGIMEPICSSLP